MNTEQRFDNIASQFEAAWNNTGDGIFAGTSSLWRGVFEKRSNFPTFPQFSCMLAHDTPFAEGIGMGQPMDLPTYSARYQDWVSRYAAALDATELSRWPETTVGTPTVIEHQGYRASLLYIKNFALAKVIEDAGARHHAHGRGLKLLEIGAGYGGVAEILLRKGIAASYTDVDLPENLFLAAQYVQAAFPERSGAVINRAAPQDGKSNDLRFLLANDLPLLNDETFDLVINTLSLGEMPAATARAYTTWIASHLAPGGLFISHNTHATRGMTEVVQRQSAYGFERLRLLEMAPQPNPAGLRHDTHTVMVLTGRASGDAPYDGPLVDAFAGLMSLGITRELAGALQAFAEPITSAEQRFTTIIRRVYAVTTVDEKYALARERVGDPAYDAAIEYVQGALAMTVEPAAACIHFANYLAVALSPLATCYAISALKNMLGPNMNPELAKAIATALERVPDHLARQIDDFTFSLALKRFRAGLELTH